MKYIYQYQHRDVFRLARSSYLCFFMHIRSLEKVILTAVQFCDYLKSMYFRLKFITKFENDKIRAIKINSIIQQHYRWHYSILFFTIVLFNFYNFIIFVFSDKLYIETHDFQTIAKIYFTRQKKMIFKLQMYK